MKKENISDALNFISDDIIEKTETTRQINKKYKIKRIIQAGVAACIVISISIASFTIIPKLRVKRRPIQNIPNNQQTEDIQLPMLTIDEISAGGDGSGFEGFMAYDISDLTNANPWYEGCGITTLPVYNNALEFNESYEPTNTDYDKMYDLLYQIADVLGLDTDKVKAIQYDSKYPYLSFEDNGIMITIQDNLTAIINFDPAVTLPEGYNFTYLAPYEDTTTVAEYLKNEFKDILFYDNPHPNIYGGDYWIDNDSAKQVYNIQFYNKTNNITQDIINYNFYQTGFHTYYENNGKLCSIIIYNPDLSKKIGDYPIINVDTAKELLINGNYITNVPHKMKGAEHIKKVELVYKVSYREKVYMPYYRFYVELPEENRDHIAKGIKTYGAYYVPAVEGKYISNMPIYDGSFN